MRKNILTCGLLFIVASGLFAIDKPLALCLSYTHNNLGLPFYSSPIGTQLYPGFQADIEMPLSQGRFFSLRCDGSVSASFHRACVYGNVFKIGSDLIGRFETDVGFYADARLGLGYTHIFSTIPSLVVSGSSVVAGIDYGRPSLDVRVGPRLGWRLNRMARPIRLFIGADCDMILTFESGYLPVIPTTTLSAGISCPLGAE
jgi:hypothetical protein